jgi:uncharacterized protein (DUF111 family)
MKLFIDPAGGIAGDMFLAALVSAGADSGLIKKVILAGGNKLGTAETDIMISPDGSTRINILLSSERHHLNEGEAKIYLKELFSEFGIKKEFSRFGLRILQILLNAEKKAHREHHIIVNDHHARQSPGPHSHHDMTCLHEAQDIIIDIIGAVAALQNLEIEPRAILLNPVSTGSGTIRFSHGTFEVPAPATRTILETHGIEWKKGPIQKELCTPTGAAILAALDARYLPAAKTKIPLAATHGKSRGSHIYDIPPLEIFIN